MSDELVNGAIIGLSRAVAEMMSDAGIWTAIFQAILSSVNAWTENPIIFLCVAYTSAHVFKKTVKALNKFIPKVKYYKTIAKMSEEQLVLMLMLMREYLVTAKKDDQETIEETAKVSKPKAIRKNSR